MSDFIGQIEARIVELRTELAELETAVKVYRRLANGSTVKAADTIDPGQERSRPAEGPGEIVANNDRSKPPSGGIASVERARARAEKKGELAGKTVREAAEIILRESPEPLYYGDVHKAAVARGYTSGRKGGGSRSTFWSLMKRTPDFFEAVGGGKFKLKE